MRLPGTIRTSSSCHTDAPESIIEQEWMSAMHCLYCNKRPWLVSQIFHDPDFCTPTHRLKFNQQLNIAIRRINELSMMCPRGTAGFQQKLLTLADACRSHLPVALAAAQTVSSACRRIRIGEGIALTLMTVSVPRRLAAETTGQRADQDARLRRLSTMVARLRDQVEDRRNRRTPINRHRALAPILELKRAM